MLPWTNTISGPAPILVTSSDDAVAGLISGSPRRARPEPVDEPGQRAAHLGPRRGRVGGPGDREPGLVEGAEDEMRDRLHRLAFELGGGDRVGERGRDQAEAEAQVDHAELVPAEDGGAVDEQNSLD